jgi:uncharacterized protein YbjT (DUF2867 family)
VRLADLVDDPAPPVRAPDLGGPEILEAAELFGAYLRASGKRRRLIPVRLPGRVFRAYRSGAHLTPDNPSAGERWSDFLASRLP